MMPRSTEQTRRELASAATDISSPDEIEIFIRNFYGDVAQDDLLGPMFNQVAKVDWPTHLPKLAGFWNRFLFGIAGYAGNPMHEHARVHAEQPFTPEHFHRWLGLFRETLDNDWAGPNVEKMKSLALTVASVHSGQLLGQPVDLERYQSDH